MHGHFIVLHKLNLPQLNFPQPAMDDDFLGTYAEQAVAQVTLCCDKDHQSTFSNWDCC